MNIGDKVRLLHGKEQGIVHRFLPGNQVEIEIEDGFRIPVLRTEIVEISPLEAKRLVPTPPIEPVAFSAKAPLATKGIYAVFVPINDRELTLHIVNNTDWTLPYTFASTKEEHFLSERAGLLMPRTSEKVADLLMKEFENWPTFVFTFLFHRPSSRTEQGVLQRRIRCRAQSFHKRKAEAPLLRKNAYLYALDDESVEVPVSSSSVSPEKLRESLLSTKKEEPTVTTLTRPKNIVDLHLEKLPDELGSAVKDPIQIQLLYFEQQLEQAIASGMDEITFIHGVGNHVLRNEVHRRLGKHPFVQYFKDAQKEKFGYGATLVKIK